MSIERVKPDGQLLHLGVDHLKQCDMGIVELIDRLAKEEVELGQRLERVVATKMHLIKEHSKLQVKIHEASSRPRTVPIGYIFNE